MTDIELVIKIPENNYNQIKSTDDFYLSGEEKLIKGGAPLQKGHGRLIDADALDKDCEASEYHEVVSSWLDLAPTIIEADEGESEVQDANCD